MSDDDIFVWMIWNKHEVDENPGSNVDTVFIDPSSHNDDLFELDIMRRSLETHYNVDENCFSCQDKIDKSISCETKTNIHNFFTK